MNEDSRTPSDWIDQATQGDSGRALAAKAGVEQSALRRRRKNGTVTPGDIIAIARAYQLPVVDALVETGFITRDEALYSGARAAVADVSDVELSREFLRRLHDADPETDGPPPEDYII
ncbi:hypothetical protein [Tomitella gaofuii]|uniref:hypothetical protein n=1 Tax=Tomitella gaofuii TaxID=2760083 RepID=UPI0015FBA8C7|nr:hypothetical protein [Tomitella gaofuii]